MSLILNSLSKSFADHLVLDQVSLTLTGRQVVGLVGPNGSGKSTLLQIIAGQLRPDAGSVVRTPTSLTIGYVPQVADFDPNLSVAEAIAYSLSLPESDFYQIYIALNKLNADTLAFQKVGHLSSGQKTKVYLARLLVQTPDILLLDEPTNHLDLASLSWLENYLAAFPGLVLLVSHDRRFLDNTVTRIIEVDQCRLQSFGGNFTFYKAQKQLQLEGQTREYQAFHNKEKRLLARIAKVKKSGQALEDRTSGSDYYVRKKAAAAASRAKSQEKMLTKELAASNIALAPVPQNLSVIFKPIKKSSPTVAFLDHVSLSFGAQPLITDFSLVVQRGDRLALAGPNGSGKSTLIKLILGQLTPASGTVEIGDGVTLGYLPQEHDQLASSLPLLGYLMQTAHLDRTSAYRLLIHFLFTPDDFSTPINSLSSGQKSKLSLATILASGANFLILDEPTNYLDIPAREALETALIAYPGALLVVSHDRHFLDAINVKTCSI